MRQSTTRLEVATRGKGLYEISSQVVGWVKDTGMKTGLLTVFIVFLFLLESYRWSLQ